MATLASDLIADTRRHIQANTRDELNRLTSDITSTATTLTFDFAAGGIVQGAWLALDLEVVYVWSVAGQVATVQRSMVGSTKAAHTAGAVITVNPKISDYTIFTALNQEIASLSSPVNGLFKVSTYDLTGSAVISGYDLPITGLTDVLDVRYQDYGPAVDWPRLRRWNLQRDANTTTFPSGQALFFFEGLLPGRTVHVIAAAELTQLAAATTDVSTTGLPTTAYDIPPIGAAARVLAGRESKRSSVDAQPEPRSATEVPPGAARTAAANLMALRQTRIREESTRLHARHPALRRSA